MSDTNQTETPSTEKAPKTPTVLDKLKQVGPAVMDAKARKDLSKNFIAAVTAAAQADAASEAANAKLDEVVMQLAAATGGAPVRINDKVYNFGCRGSRVFLKEMTQTAPVEL